MKPGTKYGKVAGISSQDGCRVWEQMVKGWI